MIFENQSKNKKILFTIFILLLAGGISYGVWGKFSYKAEPNYCTQEAKLCPDGSYVSRSGPDCKFTPCPDENLLKNSKSGILGTVLLGPACPVVKNPPEAGCADKPYKTDLVLMTADQSRVIGKFSSDTNGEFNIKVQPGQYTIRSAVSAKTLPFCASNETIIVSLNSYAETIVYCDTGIR